MKTVVTIASMIAFAIIFWSIAIIVPLDKGGDLVRGIFWALEGSVFALWAKHVEGSEWKKITIK
jgi:hypothetical protein